MAKFTKLNIGDAVASSGGRVWKKLSAESAEDNSIVGTWVFNPTASLTDLTADMWGVYSTSSIAQSVYIAEVNHNGNLRKVTCNQALTTGGITGYRGIVLTYSNVNVAYNSFSYRSVGSTYSINAATLPNCSITFYEIVETDDRIVINGDFIAWLKANATKQ